MNRGRAPRASAVALAVFLTAVFTAAAGATSRVHNLEEALDEQRRLVASNPGRSSLWNDLGNLFILAKRTDDARTAYRMAVELNSGNLAGRFNLGLVTQEAGDLDEALSHYRSVVEGDPDHAWAHYQIGSVLEAQGRRREAISTYSHAFTLDPELVFPEINPHVIENRLMTEALILRGRTRADTDALPTVYEDRGRIIGLLVPVLPSEPDEPGASGTARAPSTSDDDPGDVEEESLETRKLSVDDLEGGGTVPSGRRRRR